MGIDELAGAIAHSQIEHHVYNGIRSFHLVQLTTWQGRGNRAPTVRWSTQMNIACRLTYPIS